MTSARAAVIFTVAAAGWLGWVIAGGVIQEGEMMNERPAITRQERLLGDQEDRERLTTKAKIHDPPIDLEIAQHMVGIGIEVTEEEYGFLTELAEAEVGTVPNYVKKLVVAQLRLRSGH